MRRLFANANYDFINNRKKAYLISGVALLLAFVTAAVWQFRENTWLNYGVDFTGGSIVQVAIVGQHSAGEIRQVVTSRVPGSQVSEFGGANEFLVRCWLATRRPAARMRRLPHCGRRTAPSR
jgi:preprotein translocase subunit SecF